MLPTQEAKRRNNFKEGMANCVECRLMKQSPPDLAVSLAWWVLKLNWNELRREGEVRKEGEQ